MIWRFILGVLFSICTISTELSAQQYRLQPGDQLSIEVLEDSALNRTVLVAPDGRITFPLLGSLKVRGLTVTQIENRIESQIASNFATRPNVFVSLVNLAQPAEPIEPKPIEIFVMGEAESPGKLELQRGATFLQALSQSGGLSRFAAGKRIQLRRVDSKGREKVYRFDYDAILSGTGPGGAFVLRSGDVIIIPERRLFEK